MSLLDRHDNTEPPADEWPTEELPADGLSAEEWPADTAPRDELPAEEWPTDELAADELAAEDVSGEEWPADELAADELPAEEDPAEVAAEEPVAYAQPSDTHPAEAEAAAPPALAAGPVKRPLYPRLLHLQHIHPNGWQRALLGEGALGLAGLLVLADLATAWTLIILPLAVAAVVKGHDLLAGLLSESEAPEP